MPNREELKRRGERHRATRDDERLRQAAAPAQPSERSAIARRVAVDYVHPLARDHLGEPPREGSEARELERHAAEPGVAPEPGQQRFGAAAQQHTMSSSLQVLAEVEDRLRGAGAVALMRQLQDGERGV